MQLTVTKPFLRDLGNDLYYAILPNYHLWGRESGFIVEPIATFRVDRGQTSGFRLVDAWLDPGFDAATIRERLTDGLNAADGSTIDQVIDRVADHIYEVADNPWFYPVMRLDRFVREALDPATATLIDGICHFHPRGPAEPSPADDEAFRRLAAEFLRRGKDGILSLIVTLDDASELVRLAQGTRADFAIWLASQSETITLDCRLYRARDAVVAVDVAKE